VALVLVDREAPAEVKQFLRDYYIRYSGPAGLTSRPDFSQIGSFFSCSTDPKLPSFL